MMGYKEQDIVNMMSNIQIASTYLPENSSNDEVREGLQKAFDFLDGILVEGRVE